MIVSNIWSEESNPTKPTSRIFSGLHDYGTHCVKFYNVCRSTYVSKEDAEKEVPNGNDFVGSTCFASWLYDRLFFDRQLLIYEATEVIIV